MLGLIKFPFEFQSAEAPVNDLPEASSWDKGIRVDTTRCRQLGMSDCFASMLEHGTDLLLERLPEFDISRDNY